MPDIQREKMLESRLNLLLGLVLLLAFASLTAAAPRAMFAPENPGTRELARMEDSVARNPSDLALVRRLADIYLELERPGLAIATLRAADPGLMEHPMVAHRLARAYESVGRLEDAVATAELAFSRCARSVGSAEAPSGTPVPRHACGGRELAVLDAHRVALGHMIDWGITDPARDSRTADAYDRALRRVRVARTF